MTDLSKFKNPFTLDGRIKVVNGVTERKAAAVAELMERTMAGDRVAKGTLEEAMVSTDAIFNVAHVAQVNVLADFPEIERKWNQIATTRPVADFRPATLYTLRPDWKQGVLGTGDPRWVAPRVPEGANYPYAYMEEEVAQQQGGIVKRGFKTGFTFEAFINDSIGFLQALPNSMRDIALDTEEWEVFSALISGVTAAQKLQGGAIPDGTVTVPGDAPFSREAIIRAIIELSNREINNRKVSVSGGFKLLVPTGQAVFVQYQLNNKVLTGIENGTYIFDVQGYNPTAGVQVIESEFIPPNQWYLIPDANSARRPVLELLQLVGHELPELRVQGNTGSYVGGGAISPFEGSFDNDSADFRLRMFSKGILWTPELVVWSQGDGTL